ncbi:uncharacterized protein TNCV_2494511 [Trichonephila clavipes]|uniref:Uncharacterized protein n=1 Tax=Trichonephila clavipes TaxID=2585209 RepID=A0A8X6RZE3_TRICX|nr:uncharacterized protein TNCV_2494511 [Trichonephila clavipes]
MVALWTVWNVDVPGFNYPRNLESPRLSSRFWQRFQDDANVSRHYSTGHPRVTTPSLACSLLLTGFSYGDHQVPVTTKRTSLNDTVLVVRDCSFGGGRDSSGFQN